MKREGFVNALNGDSFMPFMSTDCPHIEHPCAIVWVEVWGEDEILREIPLSPAKAKELGKNLIRMADSANEKNFELLSNKEIF